LYVSNLKNVLRIPLNNVTGKSNTTLPPQYLIKSSGHIRSLEIDPLNKKVFWGDFRYHTINCSDLDGGNRKTVLQYAIGYAQGIAVDWTSENIYWTDSLMNMLEVTDYRGFNRKVLFTFDKNTEPRGIITNPMTG